ncbi:hypothetical protein ZWY2020_026901 [Hordeum vulgare]|nr:hypothetical protein ZWY2020_026901 [Hordeum vulgare]
MLRSTHQIRQSGISGGKNDSVYSLHRLSVSPLLALVQGAYPLRRKVDKEPTSAELQQEINSFIAATADCFLFEETCQHSVHEII